MSLLTGKRMKISYLQAKCSRMTFKAAILANLLKHTQRS